MENYGATQPSRLGCLGLQGYLLVRPFGLRLRQLCLELANAFDVRPARLRRGLHSRSLVDLELAHLLLERHALC